MTHCTRCGYALTAPPNNQCRQGHTTEWPKLIYVIVSPPKRDDDDDT
jgi:hypothetical protein